MKKILALVLALMMVLGMVAAFAADPTDPAPTPEGSTADTTITISGLEKGDEVTLYKVIEYGWIKNGTTGGWRLTSAFAGDTDVEAVLAKINAKTSGVYSLTKEDVDAITAVINSGSFTGEKVTGGTVSDAGVYTNNVDPGMYIALVKPITAGMLYNPIIVSADYDDNGTNSIGDLENKKLGDADAIVKKETTTVEKTVSEIDLDAGREVEFTIVTTIPAYSSVYVDPFFNLHDKMSEGLVLQPDTITVTCAVGHKTPITTTADSFDIEFNSDEISALEAPASVKVTYKATLTTDAPWNVNPEKNEVTVEFSNNPNDKTGKSVLKDGTTNYTFSLDAKLLGNDGYRTGELDKVGVDANGNPIVELVQKTLSNTTKHYALEGATFGLYTDSSCADDKIYKNKIDDVPTTWDHIMSDENGLLGMDGMDGIRGLDAGTYYLKELKAPTGYIKSTHVSEIVIAAEYKDVDVTEYFDPADEKWYAENATGRMKVTYTVKRLKNYTVTIDGNDATKSTYEVEENDGPFIETIKPWDGTTELINTKGVELPSTGGMGTTILYIGGSILVLAAVILLVTKRRMKVED